MKTAYEMTQNVIVRKNIYEKKKKTRLRVSASVVALALVCGTAALGLNTPDSPLATQSDSTSNVVTSQNLTQREENAAGNMPMSSGGENLFSGYKTLISGTDSGDNASYSAPGNGQVFRSSPLNKALEEYGDGARYRIRLDIFKDKQKLSPASSEAQEICGKVSSALMEKYGAGLSLLSYSDSDGNKVTEITIDGAEKEIIDNFPVGEDFGCFIWLYSSEQTDDTGSVGVYNSGLVLLDSVAVLRHNDRLYYQNGRSISFADEDDYLKTEEFEAFADKNIGRFIGTAKNDVDSCINGQHRDENYSSELSSNTEGEIYTINGTDESEALYLVHQYENGGIGVLILKAGN